MADIIPIPITMAVSFSGMGHRSGEGQNLTELPEPEKFISGLLLVLSSDSVALTETFLSSSPARFSTNVTEIFMAVMVRLKSKKTRNNPLPYFFWKRRLSFFFRLNSAEKEPEMRFTFLVTVIRIKILTIYSWKWVNKSLTLSLYTKRFGC